MFRVNSVQFWTFKSWRTRAGRNLFLAALLWASASAAVAAEENFTTLSVGKDTYTNVTVLNKTRTDLFISHAHGMANIKVRDLDSSTQVRLGYELEQPKQNRMEKVLQGPDITQFESDPRVQEFEEKLAEQIGDTLEKVDLRIAIGIVSGIVLLYLWFCFLCRSICVKTSNPPSALVWLPVLKLIPLFKAAGMSPWWLLTMFLPPISLITYIIWSFKIVQARGKHPLFAVMLLLPGANLLSFLFLALSGSGEAESTNRKVISLQSSPRRDAA